MATQMLLATDWSRSALQSLVSDQRKTTCYTPYGWRPGRNDNAETGFTGQICEPELNWYLLGNGHRGYNPALMRFSSPDHLSPFGKGGVNAYMYCQGNPVNYADPRGTSFETLKVMFGALFGPKIIDHGMALFNMANYTWDRRQAIKAGVKEIKLPEPTSKRHAAAAAAGVGIGIVSVGIAKKNVKKIADGLDGVIPSENVEDLGSAYVAAGMKEVAEVTILFSNVAINEVAGGLRYDYAERRKKVAWAVEDHVREQRESANEPLV